VAQASLIAYVSLILRKNPASEDAGYNKFANPRCDGPSENQIALADLAGNKTAHHLLDRGIDMVLSVSHRE
jgi:hypothetical protein